MFLFIPSLLIVILLAPPTLLTPSASKELEVRGQRTPGDAKQDSIKVVISEGCATQSDSADGSHGGKEIDLAPGSPLVLTHKIKLVPSGSVSGSGPCGCETDFAALQERLESLEREVSSLREKCGGAEGGCCTSNESKGAGCSTIKPDTNDCPNECSDQGRCVDKKCVCFPGFSGLDCSESSCPTNCGNNGRCENGKCVCDPGFTGPNCSQRACPNNCNSRGRCVEGKCVCDIRFTGDDCSENACPGNCNNRGRCVNGQCICNDGFTGFDCSERTCPNDCFNRGRCVDGKCICDIGFTGDDCSENACLGNCNNRGRCVNGQCICDDGFTGSNCSEKACLGNCNNRGRCVDGKCVCEVGFTGPDCGAKSCPGNCNNRGRCIRGSCVCRRGFTGADCSKCQEGMTGTNCDVVMSGVSDLSTQDISETSVTLVWTPPPVQYETYYITFTSQKEGDQPVTAQVEGDRSTFTQTGLAAGQVYRVSVVGEMDGRRGAEVSTEFTTLISGPSSLKVVKTTSTSAVVQWEPSLGEIDRYLLTVTPNGGEGWSQQMTIPVGQNSAHIQQLKAGLLYDVSLVAEKGSTQSRPAFTTTVPGETLPKVSTAALTLQGTPVPRQDTGEQELNPSLNVQAPDRQERNEDGFRGLDGPDKDPSPSLTAKTKPLISTMVARNVTRPNLRGKPALTGKPKVPRPLRFNATRGVTGGTKVVPGPFKKAPAVTKTKQTSPNKPKPNLAIIADQTREASSSERLDPHLVPWTDSEVNPQSNLEEPIAAAGFKEKPDVSMAGHGNKTDPGSPGPTRAVQSQEKKCVNKIKVTHFRFPLKDRDSGCKGDGRDKDLGVPPTGETDLDYVPDPLHKLISETFDDMNITTFSVHLLKPSNLSVNAETTRKEILGGFSPLLSLTSSSSPSPSPPSSDTLASVESNELNGDDNNPSTTEQNEEENEGRVGTRVSLTSLSNEKSSSDEETISGNKGELPTSKHFVDEENPKKLLIERGHTPFRRPPPKGGYRRRPFPNVAPLRNQTRPNLRIPTRPSTALPSERDTKRGQVISTDLPATTLPSISKDTNPSDVGLVEEGNEGSIGTSVSTTSLSNISDEESLPLKVASESTKEQTTSKYSETEQNPKRFPIEQGRIPFRRPPPNSGYRRRPVPNVGPLQNRTRLNLRFLTRPSQALHSETETKRQQVSPAHPSETLQSERDTKRGWVISNNLPATALPSVSKDTIPSDAGLMAEENEGRVGTTFSMKSLSNEEKSSEEENAPVKVTGDNKDETTASKYSENEQNPKKLLIERGHNPFRRPPPNRGNQHRPFPNVGPLQNRTRPNLRFLTRPSQALHSETEIERERVLSNDLPVTAPPSISKDSHPTDTESVKEEIEDSTGMSVVTTNFSIEFHQIPRESGGPSSQHPSTKVGNFHRPQYRGSFQNKTRTNMRPPLNPYSGLVHKPVPTKKLSSGSRIPDGSQTRPSRKDNTMENQLEEEDGHRSNQGVQITPTRTSEVTASAQMAYHSSTVRPHTEKIENGENALIQEEKETGGFTEKLNDGKSTDTTRQGGSTKLTSSPSRPLRPIVPPNRRLPPTTTRIRTTSHSPRKVFVSETEETRHPKSDSSSTGLTREPLDSVRVTNQTSDGIMLVWDSPEGKYKNFVVTRTRAGKDDKLKKKERDQNPEKNSDNVGDIEAENQQGDPTKEMGSDTMRTDDDNTVPERYAAPAPRIQSSTENEETFKTVLPGSDRSFWFEGLVPKTDYTLTLLGKSPGLLSRLHKLVISTGPEPPTNIEFSKVTENSVTVSWTKPKSPVSGFKVTYTHGDDGEPVSVSVDSDDSSVGLSKLSPGSSYEVTIISTLELDESDPARGSFTTLPDPPTDLRAVNVTDTTALLLWRPALAPVDKYAIVYGAGTGSELRVTVSGNDAEHRLSGLEGSTTYTVTVTGQLSGLESPPTSISFTTKDGQSNDGPQDFRASKVTPRTALLSWKPPSTPVSRYRLTYQTEGQEIKEVIVDAGQSQYNLVRLHPGSRYAVQLQAEIGGRYAPAVSSEFMTGTLRFPFPTDCTQEQLNGIQMSGEVEIFPQGRLGTPITVYCDMETDGGGWTVFQRRKDGSVDFFRSWKEYTKGFGDLNGEFWLGLDSLHNLTAMTRMTLRIDLRDGNESAYAQYSTFEVAKRYYRLTVGGYSGTAGDSLSYHNNRIFSTKDRDLAPFITRCAMSYRGGWWYKNCHQANLNGLYGVNVKHQGVIWTTWKGKKHSIPFTEMKMRPRDFRPPSQG
ncbi:uncharacterized protein tnxbb [Pholidichthys leucotaenia]